MAILENLFTKGPILENFVPRKFPNIYGISIVIARKSESPQKNGSSIKWKSSKSFAIGASLKLDY